MMERLSILVMMGGPSAERDVSLRTGTAVAKALESCGHQVQTLDPVPGRWTIPAGVDAVFLALHGTYGEDGTVQSELDVLGVPYTGCGAEASRIAFDKAATKDRCVASGVPTPRSFVVDSPLAGIPEGWQPPFVIKPVRQGSSVGLQFCDRQQDWRSSIAGALEFDTAVLVEERICGRETTVGILDGEPLPVVEVRPRHGAYDYQNKYTPGATEYICPADFEARVTRRIQEAAMGAFRAVGGRDYARVDVMVRDGEPFVLEVNTLPGMTETSLLPKAASAAGIDYASLCERMVALALKRAGQRILK